MNLRTTQVREFGRQVLLGEARALDALGRSIGDTFEIAVNLIHTCSGKLIVGGLGKSGHVARKIAATFASTGTTAIFLHLAEAVHGDLGMLLEQVWDYHFDPATNVIDVHVSRLRRKLEEGFESPLLHTVRGAGYVLEA